MDINQPHSKAPATSDPTELITSLEHEPSVMTNKSVHNLCQ